MAENLSHTGVWAPLSRPKEWWEEVERKGERFRKVSEGKCARKQRGKEKKGKA